MAMADGADQLPSGRRATISPEPKRIEPRNPSLSAVNTAIPWHGVSHDHLGHSSRMSLTLAPANILRGISPSILSFGLMKDSRIAAAFLHSPVEHGQPGVSHVCSSGMGDNTG